MATPFFDFDIGSPNWIDALHEATESVDPNLWLGFQRCPERDIASCERLINRRIPQDFRMFLLDVGAGSFPVTFGGCIHSPVEIVEACIGPLLMVLGAGSLASDSHLRLYYTTRGQWNPNPEQLKDGLRSFDGCDLLNVIQIGNDGSCGYYQLNVANDNCDCGFCILTPSPAFEAKAPSFAAGLKHILLEQWKTINE